jgi:hypothetical protein
VQLSSVISESVLNYCSSVQSIFKDHKDFEDEKIRVENWEKLTSNQFMKFWDSVTADKITTILATMTTKELCRSVKKWKTVKKVVADYEQIDLKCNILATQLIMYHILLCNVWLFLMESCFLTPMCYSFSRSADRTMHSHSVLCTETLILYIYTHTHTYIYILKCKHMSINWRKNVINFIFRVDIMFL